MGNTIICVLVYVCDSVICALCEKFVNYVLKVLQTKYVESWINGKLLCNMLNRKPRFSSRAQKIGAENVTWQVVKCWYSVWLAGFSHIGCNSTG
jgi:hypothetical protein